MFSNPIGKSFIRQKLKSSIILLLLTIASFFFVNNFIQLTTINSQIEQAANFYKSIGRLNVINEEEYDVTEGIEFIKTADDIDFIDNRSGVQGIIKDFNSAYVGEDIPKFTDSQTATLTDVYFIATVRQIITNNSKADDLPSYILSVNVEENIAGFEEYAKAGDTLMICLDPSYQPFSDDYDKSVATISSLPSGQRIFIRAHYDPDYCGIYQGDSKSNKLLFLPLGENLVLDELAKNEILDLSQKKYANISKDMDVLKQNIRTLFIISTKDMSSIPEFQEQNKIYYLLEGRWLNMNDHIEGAYNIVINQKFASMRGLKVGDTINIDLRKKEDSLGFHLITQNDIDNWQNYPIESAEYKIVGLYEMAGIVGNRKSIFAYVPDSTMPEKFKNRRYESFSTSFVLKSSKDEKAFVSEYQNKLNDLGFTLKFEESNADSFWQSVTPIQSSNTINLIVSTIILILSVFIILFIYRGMYAKYFAIMRTMGLKKSSAIKSYIIPFAISSAISILIAITAAYYYAQASVKETLSGLDLSEKVVLSTDINVSMVVISGLIIFLSVNLLNNYYIVRLSKRPLLELLSDNYGGHQRKGSVAAGSMPNRVMSDPVRDIKNDDVKAIQSTSIKFSKRALYKNLMKFTLRKKTRTLSILLIFIMFPVFLMYLSYQITANEFKIEQLYNNVNIAGFIEKTSDNIASSKHAYISHHLVDTFRNSVQLDSVIEISSSPFDGISIFDNETESLKEIEYNFSAASFNEVFDTKHIKLINLIFDSSFDEKQFSDDYNAKTAAYKSAPVLVSSSFLKQTGLALGDVVYPSPSNKVDRINIFSAKIVGVYDNVIINSDAMNATITKDYSMILQPSAYDFMFPDGYNYELFHFVINRVENKRLLGDSQYLVDIVANDTQSLLPLKLHLWDSELKNVMRPLQRSLDLMKLLMPIIAVVFFLVGLLLTWFFNINRIKEYVIIHILGASKKYISFWIVLESLTISIMGFLISLLLVIAFLSVDVFFYKYLIVFLFLSILSGLIGAGIAIRKLKTTNIILQLKHVE